MKEQISITRAYQFLEIFQKLIRVISTINDHQQVMEIVVSRMPELFGSDACTIRLRENVNNKLVLKAAYGLSREYLSRKDIDNRETLAMVISGHPVWSNNVDTDPSKPFRKAAAREGVKSVLTLPVASQGEVFGVMRLLSKQNRVFTDDEIALAMALSEQVAIALRKAQLFSGQEAKIRFLKEVQEVSALINSSLELDTILTTIVERISDSLKATGSTIRLINSVNNRLELKAASPGLSSDYLGRKGVEREKSMSLVLSGDPVAIYDVSSDKRVHYSELMQKEGICSLLAVPVKENGKVIGVLRVLSKEPRIFSSAEINFAVIMAEVGGTAIEKGRRYNQIKFLLQQVEENESFLENIINCLDQQLVVLDREERIVLSNRAFLEYHKIGKALGIKYNDICDDHEKEESAVQQALNTGKSSSCIVAEKDMNGETRWFDQTVTPMVDVDREDLGYLIQITRDITERKRLEQERIHSSRLEGILELAGTVAHEVNTPLFAALGTAQLMEEELEGEMAEDIQLIIKNLNMIRELSRKMLNMTDWKSKGYVGSTKILDLSDELSES